MQKEFLFHLHNAKKNVTETKNALKQMNSNQIEYQINHALSKKNTILRNEKIYEALLKISEPLANSYDQINKDIKDDERISWAGPAHEIREILTTLLRMLAPDEKVILMSWYQQVNDTKGPTQKQRVRYVLEMHGIGINEQKVCENVTNLEKLIEDLVRSTYGRASDAAHRFKPKQEVVRILRYFDAFAYDLLNLD